MIEIVNAEMLRALRVVSVERGHDPARLRARRLRRRRPAARLCACGGARDGDGARPGSGRRAVGARPRGERRAARRRPLLRLPARGGGELPAEGEADLRYRGQSFELTVPLGPPTWASASIARTRSGTARPTAAREIELVAVRTAEVQPGPRARLPAGEPLASRRARGRSSSTALLAGFPPGGWGLGMESHRD